MFNRDFWEILGDAIDECAEWEGMEDDLANNNPFAECETFERDLALGLIPAV